VSSFTVQTRSLPFRHVLHPNRSAESA